MEDMQVQGDEDIAKALKEFELKAKADEQASVRNIEPAKQATPKMVSWVFKVSRGKIKDQRQAEYVLLGIVVILMTTSLFLFFHKSDSGQSVIKAPPGRRVIYPPNEPPRLAPLF